MQKTINVKRLTIFLGLLFLMFFFVNSVQSVKANDDETKEKELYWQSNADTYKLDVDSGYEYTESDRVDEMPYGRKYAGFFYVHGVDVIEKRQGSYIAYGTQGTITFGYSYDNSLKENKEGQWNIEDDGQNTVKGIKLKKDVDSGAIIVERSYDTVNWSVVEKRYDFFDSHPDGEPNIYTTKLEDVKHGAYYRVTVAYRIEYERGFGKRNKRAECVEVYSFYVGEYQSSLHVREVYSGGEIALSDSATITHGFSVMSDSADSSIFVKGPDDPSDFLVPQNSVFTQAGDYSIRFRTALEDEYKYSLTIREGTEAVEVKPLAYSGDGSYKKLQLLNSPVGDRNMTSLFIEQTKGYTIKESEQNGVPAISVNGQTVTLYLQLNYAKEIGKGMQLVNDSFGGKEGEELFGIVPGPIESGALIIQTSIDGQNWESIDKGRYSYGLYTTDFQNQYGSGRRIKIYTPDGEEVLKGLYVKVLYVFEAKLKDKTNNYVEEYTFYLSNSNVDAVLFHNLSADGKVQELLSEEDQNTVDILKRAETLDDYTQTLSGFRIDTSLNPTVSYEIKRDGQPLVGSTTTFEETGKYEIILNAVGDSKRITLFVDRMSTEESMKQYFGEGFLSGKRVYAETEYPTYIAGLTSYNLLEVPNTMLPVSGTIKNLTTKNEIEISFSRQAKSGILTEPGEYVAKLYTNKTFASGSPIGDTKIFTFRFFIIPESETPGPRVNQESLEEYAKTNISDLNPRYYGLTYSSAGKGFITIAFSTWEDAYDYAYENEKGMVEQQEDGTFCYRGKFLVAKKEKYESTWDLTDAMVYFAKQAVQECFFDMSDDDSYVTLTQEVIDHETNLKKLELSHSVVVIGVEQKEKLLALDELPIVSPKKYALLDPGLDQPVKRGDPSEFQFVKDKYEIDSRNILIFDCNNMSYSVVYGEGIGGQLEEAGCASGEIRIVEQNKYDDTTEYKAVFIRKGENLAKVSCVTYQSKVDNGQSVTVDMSSEERSFQTGAFRLLGVEDLTDKYTYVRVSHNGTREYLLNDALGKESRLFSEPGNYTIRCINRLGYFFEFTITIPDSSNFVTIRCVDDKGTVKEEYAYTGDQNVKLPEFEREGYELVGYVDCSNNMQYTLTLSEVNFTGMVTLEAVWEPKDCHLVITDTDDNRINDIIVKYRETVDMAKVCEENGINASEWYVNGVAVENGLITIQKEGETFVKVKMSVENSEKTGKAEKTREGGKTVLLVLGVLAFAGLIGGTVVLKRKQNEKNEQ